MATPIEEALSVTPEKHRQAWTEVEYTLLAMPPISVARLFVTKNGVYNMGKKTRNSKPKLETHQAEPIEGLDEGIQEAVGLLRKNGIETFASCEGTPGHAYPEPTIRFFGRRPEGFKALAVALQHGLPVRAVRRTWPVDDGEPHGPYWEMVFYSRGLLLSEPQEIEGQVEER